MDELLQNGWTHQATFWKGNYHGLGLHVLQGIQVLRNNNISNITLQQTKDVENVTSQAL